MDDVTRRHILTGSAAVALGMTAQPAAAAATGGQPSTGSKDWIELETAIKEMILDRKPPSEIRKRSVAEGMTSHRQAALEKVRLGVTSLKEINRVTFIEQSE